MPIMINRSDKVLAKDIQSDLKALNQKYLGSGIRFTHDSARNNLSGKYRGTLIQWSGLEASVANANIFNNRLAQAIKDAESIDKKYKGKEIVITL